MAITLEINTNIIFLRFVVEMLHTSSRINRFHAKLFFQVLRRRKISIICLNKADSWISGHRQMHCSNFVDFICFYSKLIRNFLEKLSKYGSLPITIDQFQFLIFFNTKLVKSYYSTIRSASPSKLTKLLCWVLLNSLGNFPSVFTKSAPHLSFKN